MHATLLALTTPSCAQPPSWNLVLGNFHRFSNVISIKYSNVLLKCKTQLTEIKISRKGEEEEWEWQRESGMRGVAGSVFNPYRVVSPAQTSAHLGPHPSLCCCYCCCQASRNRLNPRSTARCLASIFNHFVTPLAEWQASSFRPRRRLILIQSAHCQTLFSKRSRVSACPHPWLGDPNPFSGKCKCKSDTFWDPKWKFRTKNVTLGALFFAAYWKAKFIFD